MKNHTLNQIKAYLVLILVAGLYQNFDFSTMWTMPVANVTEEIRTAHARELLGDKYDSSVAARAEQVSTLNMAIYAEVSKRLPKAFKDQAIDVSTAIIDESMKYGFDPVFVMAVIRTESSFNPLAKGGVGELGLMQLRPETAAWIAKINGIVFHDKHELKNPVKNVQIGVAYLSWLRGRFGAHANKYLSAYNMGAGMVRKMYKNDTAPRVYSEKVMKNYRDTYMKLVASSGANLIARN